MHRLLSQFPMIPTFQSNYRDKPLHTKSRNGCLVCKRRRVKCNEQRPTCANCEKYGATCAYGELFTKSKRHSSIREPSSWSPPCTIPVRAAVPTAKAEDDGNVDTKVSLRLPPALPGCDAELWCQEMELMHHYTSVTAGTLCLRQDMAHTWRVIIPRQGYGRQFVIHGVLAISAAHKAFLEPENSTSYLQMCDYEATLGSQQFRSELENVHSDNWKALFSFAALITLHSFMLPCRLGNQKLISPLANMVEMVTLLRGMRTALDPLLTRMSDSEFSPLIYGIRLATAEELSKEWLPSFENTYLPNDTFKALRCLQEFQSMDLPHSCLEDYQTAAVRLEYAAKLIALAGYNAESGVVLGWLFQLSERLLPDIEAQKSHALVLMAYFAVFLLSLETNFWYSRGWARQIFEQVESKLGEDAHFREVLRWPRKQFLN